jgi:hypothetical protein
MGLKRILGTRTFAVTLITGGLLFLAVGAITWLVSGALTPWPLVLTLTGLATFCLGLIVLPLILVRERTTSSARHEAAVR